MIWKWNAPITAFRAALRAGIFAVREQRILAHPATVQYRLLRCAICPELDIQSMQCKSCACFVRSKALLASEECPKKFWQKEYQQPDDKT